MSTCFEDHVMEPEKKKRTRKKRILKELQRQIEFYFGNANLRHDKFLNSKVRKNNEGFVSIELIASFKEIKKMSDNMKLIVRAIKNSNFLEMNENCTLVRRRCPPPKDEDAEARTVYIERLPQFVDRHWLRDVFSCCGEIEYISLPRYKNSKEVKGFAFVEYKTAAESEKACQVLNTVYSTANKPNGMDCDRPNRSNDVRKSSVSRSKRRRTSSSASSTGEWKDDLENIFAPRKRHKLFDYSYEDRHHYREDHEQFDRCSVQPSCNDNHAIGAQTENETTSKVCKVEPKCKNDGKRRRKRKKKVKEDSELEIPPLYVISKKEWSRLKDIYKSLQRSEASKLKRKTKEENCSCKKAMNFRGSCKRKCIDEKRFPALNGKILGLGCIANENTTKPDCVQEAKEVSPRDSSHRSNTSNELT